MREGREGERRKEPERNRRKGKGREANNIRRD